MKKIIIFIASVLLLVGCGTASNKSDERIISLAPNITETIIELGGSKDLIAVDLWSEFEDVKDLDKVDAYQLNTEQIIALKPTKILMLEYMKESNEAKFLSDNDIEVVFIKSEFSISDIYESNLEIGKAIGKKDAAKNLNTEMKNKIAEIENMYKDETLKTVYFEIDTEPNIFTVGSNTFINEMISIAGGENIFKNEPGYFSASTEQIIAANPDYIITNVSTVDNPLDNIKKRNGFDIINAVKNNNMGVVNTNYTSRATFNVVKGIEEIAKILHEK